MQGKIAALRRKTLRVAAWTGVSLAVVVAVEWLVLVMFLDWWLELPWTLRLILLIGQAAVFGCIVVRFVIQPIMQQPDDDELALQVERAQPGFQSRLIAAIQLPRPGAVPAGASAAMAEATVEETEAMAEGLDFSAIVSTRKVKRLAWLAAAMLLLGAIALSAGGEVTGDLLKRAFLSNTPVPRKTRVIVFDGDKVIGRGDDVRLEGFAHGVVPERGKVEVRYANRRSQDFSLEKDPKGRNRFGRTLENIQESFRYVIRLNDGRSQIFEVAALPRPMVARLECEQDFPDYTGLKTIQRPLGDLSLLAGSRLRVRGRATKELFAGYLKMVGTNAPYNFPMVSAFPPMVVRAPIQTGIVPLHVNPSDPAEFTAEFGIPAAGLSGFSIELVDKEEMASKDAAVYRIEIIPDKAPVARILYPDRKEELITREATLLIDMSASDDFAIEQLQLRYKIASVDGGAERALEMDLEGERPAELHRSYPWKIGSFDPLLSEGSTIEFWIEARDNNNVTGPGIGRSDRQIAKVVSVDEKRSDLLNRAGDYLGSISDVASEQEKVNRTLGAIILEKTGPQ